MSQPSEIFVEPGIAGIVSRIAERLAESGKYVRLRRPADNEFAIEGLNEPFGEAKALIELSFQPGMQIESRVSRVARGTWVVVIGEHLDLTGPGPNELPDFYDRLLKAAVGPFGD